jgi:hypothetical protein
MIASEVAGQIMKGLKDVEGITIVAIQSVKGPNPYIAIVIYLHGIDIVLRKAVENVKPIEPRGLTGANRNME